MRSLSYMFISSPFRCIEPQVDSSCTNHFYRPLSLVPHLLCARSRNWWPSKEGRPPPTSALLFGPGTLALFSLTTPRSSSLFFVIVDLAGWLQRSLQQNLIRTYFCTNSLPKFRQIQECDIRFDPMPLGRLIPRPTSCTFSCAQHVSRTAKISNSRTYAARTANKQVPVGGSSLVETLVEQDPYQRIWFIRPLSLMMFNTESARAAHLNSIWVRVTG